MTETQEARGTVLRRWLVDARMERDVLAVRLAEAEEALETALELRHRIFRSVPVRDETRDAHFDLEHLRQVLARALAASRKEQSE